MTLPDSQRVGFEEYVHRTLSPAARERVTFTGPLTRAQIRPLRQRAQVTVVASRCENLPYALLEAMAAGCPIVSTDWPGSEEIVLDEATGLLTPVGQVDAMADRLRRLLDAPDHAAKLGAAALDRCRRHFSLEIVGDRLLNHYATALSVRQ